MTHTMRGSIDGLRAAMSGPVIGPADPGYDEARRVWNADIDRRPAMIARCTSAADVAAAVTFAAETGLEMTVRGGAHSMSGESVADHGLMIDLSQLNQVSVDAQAKHARAGGGALLADLSTRRRRRTAWRCPPAMSVTPVSPGSRSAAAWDG
jgi:FAD/FMN-containing dehydrogenase